MRGSLVIEWKRRLRQALSRPSADRSSLLVRVLSFLIKRYPRAHEVPRELNTGVSIVAGAPFTSPEKRKADYKTTLIRMSGHGSYPTWERELPKNPNHRETAAILALVVLTLGIFAMCGYYFFVMWDVRNLGR